MNGLSKFLKSKLKTLFRRFGYIVLPIEEPVASNLTLVEEPVAPSLDLQLPVRLTIIGALHNLEKVGFVPDVVIDIGAAYGDFTTECLSLFPEAGYLLMEPLHEYEPYLTKLVREHPRAVYVPAAAGEKPGTLTINVHPDLFGSSFFLETEELGDVNGEPRDVRVSTVDQEIEAIRPKGPILLKVDVQGAELMVLAGAEKTLIASEIVILETTLFGTFLKGPIIHEVIAYMIDRNFCIYDIVGNLYRPLDGALIQVDIVFAKKDSLSRRFQAYATPEQMKAQNELFLRWASLRTVA